jgi:hypothetical protein
MLVLTGSHLESARPGLETTVTQRRTRSVARVMVQTTHTTPALCADADIHELSLSRTRIFNRRAEPFDLA